MRFGEQHDVLMTGLDMALALGLAARLFGTGLGLDLAFIVAVVAGNSVTVNISAGKLAGIWHGRDVRQGTSSDRQGDCSRLALVRLSHSMYHLLTLPSYLHPPNIPPLTHGLWPPAGWATTHALLHCSVPPTTAAPPLPGCPHDLAFLLPLPGC